MLEDYKALLRFPSISADPAYKDDVQACAEWIVGQLESMGFANCEAIATEGNPVVYGEWLEAGPDWVCDRQDTCFRIRKGRTFLCERVGVIFLP